MSQTPEISIIVPIYNVEKYLRRCLDSIEAQTFRDWECILVNDGSPDGSEAICEEFVKRDSRFLLINRENGGISATRNDGLSAARGKYIGFVDPDDWTEPKLFSRLHELITRYDADVAQVGFWNEYTDFTRPKHLTRTVCVLDRKQAVLKLFEDKSVPSYLWNKLFRREVTSTHFPEGKQFEDISALTHWMLNINRMVLAPDLLYHYRRRKGSIVNSNFSKNRLDYIDICCQRAAAFSGILNDSLGKHSSERYMWKILIAGAKTIARMEPDSDVRNEAVEKISTIAQKMPAPSLLVLNPKRWLRAHMLRKNPAGFICLMRMVYKADFSSKHRNSSLFD